jgi:hypothetical protein
MWVYFMTIAHILGFCGLFYGHFIYFGVIWNIFPCFECCTKKNLATLGETALAAAPLHRKKGAGPKLAKRHAVHASAEAGNACRVKLHWQQRSIGKRGRGHC